jgi:hypothetical protein
MTFTLMMEAAGCFEVSIGLYQYIRRQSQKSSICLTFYIKQYFYTELDGTLPLKGGVVK